MNNKYKDIIQDQSIDQSKLPNCGCGGKPIAYFSIYENKFVDVEIFCERCGITTGICQDEITALDIWFKAFGNIKH